LYQTVRNQDYRPIILDGLKPSKKNRLDPFLDDFFQFLDGLKPSKIPVVIFYGQRFIFYS